MMSNKRILIGGGILLFLILANLISYLLSDWGLITVKVHDVPLSQVIKSIERQGWVTIYSNVDPTTKVTMYVDKVPLAEALDSLSTTVGGQWKLAFFVGPAKTDVMSEIHAFEAGGQTDDLKVYSFPTMLQMLSSEDVELPAADPRKQSWPGVKAVAATPAPASSDGTQPAGATPSPDNGGGNPDATASDDAPNYLRSFAEAANIWIMAPASWTPTATHPPAPDSSIITAVKRFVSQSHGSLKQAFVLEGRGPGRERGGPRGGMVGGDIGWDSMVDRVKNAINGMPAASQNQAITQLNEEIQFHDALRAAAPDLKMTMMREHRMQKAGNNFMRHSPQQRAQMFQRAVAARTAAKG